MKKTHVGVQKEFCGECSLALMRFIGGVKGVESVAAEEGRVAITFDENLVSEERVLKMTRDNIERLGYKIVEGND